LTFTTLGETQIEMAIVYERFRKRNFKI